MSVWPEGIQPARCSWSRARNDVVSESPVTRARQIVRRGRPLWNADIAWRLKPWTVSEARWHLENLEGGKGKIEVRDYGAPTLTVSGIVALATSAGATSVVTAGWTRNQTAIAKAGYQVAIDRSLYILLSDANSDSFGYATLSLSSPVTGDITASTSVELFRPRVPMRMTTPDWSGSRSATDGLWATSLKLIERVT